MSSALAMREPVGGFTSSVQINSIGEVFKLASALSEAHGFVPQAYAGKPNAIAAAILAGIELGLGPMESMREISVVQGRPTLSSGCMLARAIRAGVRVEWLEATDKAARLKLTRAGTSYEQSWTIEDAKRAGLLEKSGPWKQYPAAMLRARCISAGVRAFCPDVIGGGGLYTPEEAADIEPQRPAVQAELPKPTVELEHGEVVEVPETFADCHDESDLRAFAKAKAAAIGALRNGHRAKARERCTEAAARCGMDADEALELFGLKEGV